MATSQSSDIRIILCTIAYRDRLLDYVLDVAAAAGQLDEVRSGHHDNPAVLGANTIAVIEVLADMKLLNVDAALQLEQDYLFLKRPEF